LVFIIVSINLLFRSFILILGCLVVVVVCCFLSLFGHVLFIYHCDTHFYSHRRLAGSDSCPERWQANQPTVPKVQISAHEGSKNTSILFGPGVQYYVTDLTITSGTESEPEEESDEVQVYLVHVSSSLSLFHTLSFGFGDLELSYRQSPHCWSSQSYLTPTLPCLVTQLHAQSSRP